MVEYGDSRDRYAPSPCILLHLNVYAFSYYVNNDHYTSEKNVARHHAGQKLWPRAVYIRRAR